MRYLAILGRLPNLSIAELESVFGASNILQINNNAVIISSDELEAKAPNLGGIIKIAKVLKEVPSKDWSYVQDYMTKNLPLYLNYLPEGKIHFGLSAYNFPISPARVSATALSLKKIAKNQNKSVRVVPNKNCDLNSAQVIHNKLLSDNGWEILAVATSRHSTFIAQTVYVQDIDAYAARDQKRPMRDARVGMLPPKLAQTIINLSLVQPKKTVLDPFCGTGVVLQEALLMNINANGTDIDNRMVEYSIKNLAWLSSQHSLNASFQVAVGDATHNTWPNFDAIACETYLGRPLSTLPDQQTLSKIVQDCDTIHKKFLQNVASQTKPGFRMCIAVPAWKIKNNFRHLPVLDRLEELGYNRISFVHVETKDLIYYREDQTTARELVVLERI